MPTNQDRRQAAQRKLERQQERRQEKARTRRQVTTAASVVGVVLVVGLVVLLVTLTGGSEETPAATEAPAPTETAAPTDTPAPTETAPAAEPVALPTARATPLPATVDCAYPTDGAAPAARENTPPEAADVSTEGTVDQVIATSAGDVPVTLDRALAPCAVQSFLSLAGQGYFDDTPCHRLTTDGIFVMQCGDPTGEGTGGPGYTFANEFPTDAFAADDPAAQAPAIYPRGTLAMANAGPDTNGSQFFLVYDDSPLPPQYTVFGSISETGLQTLDAVAAAGTADGATDGAPATPVTISSVTPVS